MLDITWEQLERRLFVIKNHSPSMHCAYQVIYKRIYAYFLDKDFNEDTVSMYIASLQKEGKAGATINNYAKLLKHICFMMKSDCMRDYTYRKDKGSNIVPWTSSELQLLQQCAYSNSFREGVIVQTLIETAIRNDELCELKAEDFTGTELRLRETKSQEIQYAQVLPDLAEKLNMLIKDSHSPYIFGKRGKLYRDTLNQYIRSAGLKTGIKKDIRAHIIRHSVCTIAGKRNANLGKVKNFMRHKRIDTTMRYMHLDKEDVREVSETIATGSMTFETLVKRIKDFRDQFPNLPYKISLSENQDRVVLEVCR